MPRKCKLEYPVPARITVDTPASEVRLLLRHLGKRWGFACPEDWYELKAEDLWQIPGLLERTRNPIRAARMLHPELNPLLFTCRQRHGTLES